MAKKRTNILLIGLFFVIVIIGGITYAIFNYTKTGNVNSLHVGRLYFNSSQSEPFRLTNVFPIYPEATGALDDDERVGTIEIDIVGDTDLEDGVEYLISIVNSNIRTTNGNVLPLSLDITVGNGLGTASDNYFTARNSKDTTIYKRLVGDTLKGNQAILVGYIKPNTESGTIEGVDGKITIKAYFDANVIAITDTYDGTESDEMATTTEWVDDRIVFTTSEWKSFLASGMSFQIKVEANEGIWVETSSQKVQRAINAKINATTNSCNPVWVDDMGTSNDESDDITYFSGTNDCVDMNYVWYSGKLWRITAIYPNGVMKMITEDAITAINWGSTVEYNGSWIYQWVNEDFYDTLVNPSDILVSNSTWNYSTDSNSTPRRPESIATQKTVTAPVGLLNAYEYYNSYRCVGSTVCTGSSYSTGYLYYGYNWWLITPYSTTMIRSINANGSFGNESPSGFVTGVHPSVNLKSEVEFVGGGTKSNPYKIVGDKENPTSGVLISSRSSGEYVKFDNDIYRIVSIDEASGTTKLTRVDYIRDNGEVMVKKFASSVYFGKSTNTKTDTYSDYYLNNTWYDSISSTYKNMLTDGIYYLGSYNSSGKNYKITTCKDTVSSLDYITTKNCTKYTSEDTDKTFIGKVGLPRVGEMFAAQIGSGMNTSVNLWTITPYSASNVFDINYRCPLYAHPISTTNQSVRPSITLNSNVIITGGTGYIGGTTNSPFEIALPNNS